MITKQELVTAVREMLYDEGVSYSQTEVERFLNATGAVVAALLSSSADVTLPSLGKLVVVHQAARTAHNPQTGAPVHVPAKRVVKFRASKSLKDLVAG